eukprot:TRINITY_DN50246_c0_g1_i1.p1 TRINITY_DN50246_c0_g1~~TRINITY_DN50246_c0_g1_i1.p1  ORF type:complete len:262 (+),score=37.51 TRINITY_DN50246_c0_g1_i1:121-906(+)
MHSFKLNGNVFGKQLQNSSVICRSMQRRTMALSSWSLIYGAGALATLAAGVGIARSTGLFNTDANKYILQGTKYFKENDLQKSLEMFDFVLQRNPDLSPRLWQRGIVLYYLNRFEEGAAQFRKDVEYNPNDTEEAIWTYLCESQFLGPEKARQNFLQVGKDPRPILNKAYEVFREGGDPQQIIDQIKDQSGVKGDVFYAYLYAGLFHESNQDEEASKEAILHAIKTTYAESFQDFMVHVAKIHCLQRGWAEEYMAWRASRY